MRDTYEFQPQAIRLSDHRTLVHHHFDWGTVRADIVRRTGLARQETRFTCHKHCFLINLKGEATSGEDFVDGRRIGFKPRGPGSIVFIPALCEWRGWDEGDASGSYLLVSIDPIFAEQCLGPSVMSRLGPLIGFKDNTIETCLQRIAAELRNPDPISLIFVESQATQLLVQMVRLNGIGQEPVKGGLTPLDLKRIISIIEGRVVAPPSLEELATEIGVSRRHFFRAFKQSTGKTPHAFLAENRLNRAADLLRTTDLSATEISLECGFSSSSHFTYAFRRHFNASPLAFRRQWRD